MDAKREPRPRLPRLVSRDMRSFLKDLEEVEANFGHGGKTGYRNWSNLGDERV